MIVLYTYTPSPLDDRVRSYLNSQIRVQQHLELERLLALVPHVHHRLQTLGTERDAVHQTEIVRPIFAEVLWECGAVEAEVKLDAVVVAARNVGLGVGLA